MKKLTLNVPDTLDIDEKEMAMIVAARLYEQAKVSMGKAAEIAGMSKREFMESLHKYGVSIFNYGPDELDADIRNAADRHR